MTRFIVCLLLQTGLYVQALNLHYLDPTKLQTITPATVQQNAASRIIRRYSNQVLVEVNPLLFSSNKDVFSLRTSQGQLHIKASSGVAAVWGFNYYLKKYCKSHIGWQVRRVALPQPLPDVDEVVVANDRFRYYQNVCTVSYSFAWWNTDEWLRHVEWMALNGINVALAPVAQEAAWTRIYKKVGMTQEEIDNHFTGPAFLSWLRMGNVRGWGGPLFPSWHDRQKNIQDAVVDYMFQLGIIPVFPAFNGHVPRAFSRIFTNSTLYSVGTWNRFDADYCCGLFVDPSDPLFKHIGKMFLREITVGAATAHIYTADPFNEIKVENWSTALVQETAISIFSIMRETDENAVWLLQNWMFVHDPIQWPKDRVKAFLTSVPNGRMLVLDLQSEQWPQYELYEMYFDQPFIWCMLHNFGGTLGMFGNMETINKDVYDTRYRVNSTMIGVGLTPEGINQNYVVYDLMLESAWRKQPVSDLEAWAADYAERRYGCNATAEAWRSLLKSVYNFRGLSRIRGKYVITRRPSLKIKPWAWYKSHDLFDAFKKFVFADQSCNSPGYFHDLVDVTRQSLQYRAEQLYVNLVIARFSTSWVFENAVKQFLNVMNDMSDILSSNKDFTAFDWLTKARAMEASDEEVYMYELNARNQITLWGPNGEITDYACKQWAELFIHYYIPRWTSFLSAVADAKTKNEMFDEKAAQNIVRAMVEQPFLTKRIEPVSPGDPREIAKALYEKWAFIPGLEDLPINIIPRHKSTTANVVDIDEEEEETMEPTVVLWNPTTPE